jgi:hypothetical protein
MALEKEATSSSSMSSTLVRDFASRFDGTAPKRDVMGKISVTLDGDTGNGDAGHDDGDDDDDDDNDNDRASS